MNDPKQTAKSLVNLAVHLAGIRYHNPSLEDIADVDALSASPDDHYLVSEALIRLLLSTYHGDASIRVLEGGTLRATWHHVTTNGHTYRCVVRLGAPE